MDNGSLWKAIQSLEACASEVKTWMGVNKLVVNDTKSELLVVVQKQHSITSAIQALRRATIEPAKAVRDLGPIFDQHMSIIPQVNTICKSMYCHLRQIGKIRRHLTKESCATMVQSLVVSRLDCNNSLLFGFPSLHLNRLQVVQNNAARVVTGTRCRDHITPVLRSLHWLPVSERIRYKVLLVTFKVIDSVPHPSCSACVPKVSKTIGRRAFTHSATILWNSVDPDLHTPAAIGTFRKNLKTYLYSGIYGD